MVAEAEVAQRVERVVGAVGAGGAETEAQVRIGTGVQQAGLDGDGARDREVEFSRSCVGDGQRLAHLVSRRQKFGQPGPP